MWCFPIFFASDYLPGMYILYECGNGTNDNLLILMVGSTHRNCNFKGY